MRDALDVLPPRSREVLGLRYGLVDGREHSLADLAERFGVTSERIRQIEVAALSALRHHTPSRSIFQEYLKAA